MTESLTEDRVFRAGKRFSRALLAGMLVCGPFCGSAFAAPETLLLSPADMLAQTHSRAMMLRFTSTYRQLSGQLDFDPQTGACHIDVRFVVRSLTAPNALMRAEAMSRGFLDPDSYPETHYVGVCAGNRLLGRLTLRGQSHEFDMALTYVGTPGAPIAVHAEGSLNRYDWGLNGLGGSIGKTIRITNDISLDGAPPMPLQPRSSHAG